MAIFLISYFFWAAWHIFGVFAIETLTTLPPKVAQLMRKTNTTDIKDLLNNTRRILNGEPIEKMPYMVYLKLPSSSFKYQDYRNWLCAGIIVHEEYIITSAACIEDVGHFYIVSGLAKFSFEDDHHNNLCIRNSAKKAIWKCVPRNYVFDGHENDNVRWMNNDIAVVKMEDELDFTRRVKGCDYTPKPVCYNNQSSSYEEPGQQAKIYGWGSTFGYNDWINSRKSDDDAKAVPLREAEVEVMGKKWCKKRWGSRYHNIIENYMICTKDLEMQLSEICNEKYVDCSELGGDSDEDARRALVVPYERNSRRRLRGGGFCENDHGGPLIIGKGPMTIAIGIISASLVKEKNNQCYGPFLYTSIYKNRKLINCAIYKGVSKDCNKMFRADNDSPVIEKNINWLSHPDGPARNEMKKMSKKELEMLLKQKLASKALKNTTTTKISKSHLVEPYISLEMKAKLKAFSQNGKNENRTTLKEVLLKKTTVGIGTDVKKDTQQENKSVQKGTIGRTKFNRHVTWTSQVREQRGNEEDISLQRITKSTTRKRQISHLTNTNKRKPVRV